MPLHLATVLLWSWCLFVCFSFAMYCFVRVCVFVLVLPLRFSIRQVLNIWAPRECKRASISMSVLADVSPASTSTPPTLKHRNCRLRKASEYRPKTVRISSENRPNIVRKPSQNVQSIKIRYKHKQNNKSKARPKTVRKHSENRPKSAPRAFLKLLRALIKRESPKCLSTLQ